MAQSRRALACLDEMSGHGFPHILGRCRSGMTRKSLRLVCLPFPSRLRFDPKVGSSSWSPAPRVRSPRNVKATIAGKECPRRGDRRDQGQGDRWLRYAEAGHAAGQLFGWPRYSRRQFRFAGDRPGSRNKVREPSSFSVLRQGHTPVPGTKNGCGPHTILTCPSTNVRQPSS